VQGGSDMFFPQRDPGRSHQAASFRHRAAIKVTGKPRSKAPIDGLARPFDGLAGQFGSQKLSG